MTFPRQNLFVGLTARQTQSGQSFDPLARGIVVRPRFSARLLPFAAALLASQAALANTPDNVINGRSDLTAASTYSAGLPTAASDVTFTAVTYNPAAFTLNNAAALGIGTLNDLSATALTITNATAATTSTITLNGGANSVAPNAADLLYVASGGNLTIGGGAGTLNLALAASGNFDVVGTATINPVISGASAITKTGAGSVFLGGSNTYSGGTTINAGAMVANVAANGFGTGAITLGGGTLGFGTISGSTAGVFLGNNVTVNSASTITSSQRSNGFSGTLSGAGNVALNITNSGVFTPSASWANYTGTLTVAPTSGTAGFRLNTGFVGPTTGTVNLNSGVTLSSSPSTNGTLIYTFGSLNGAAGSLITGSGAQGSGTIVYSVGDANLNNTIASTISNGTSATIPVRVGITKTGTGILTLTGTNTYTGTTTISGGTLRIGDGTTNGSIDTSANIVDNATLVYNRTAGSSFTYGNVISGTGVVTKTGGGTQTLTGANTFTGNVNVNGGTLVASLANNTTNPTSSALGNPQSAARSINVNNGGTLQFGTGDNFGGASSTIQTPINIAAGGTVTNNGAAFNTLGPVNINGGTLTGTGGSGNTQFQMYAFGGAVTVAGTTASTISSTGSGTGTTDGYHLGTGVTTGTTFNVGATGASGGDLNVSAVLVNRTGGAGAASLTKTGAGVMNLTGANTYSGGTTITGGALLVNNTAGSGTGSGPVTVGDAAGTTPATLGGAGTIVLGAATANVVTVNSGSALSPGNGAGLLTITASQAGGTTPGTATLNLQGGSLFAAEINGATAGTLYDQVVLNGTTATLNLAGNLVLTLGGGFTPAPGSSFTLINNVTNGTTQGAFVNAPFGSGTFTSGGTTFDVGMGDGNDVVLTAVVPEPSTWAMMAGGLGLLLGLQRFRTRRA